MLTILTKKFHDLTNWPLHSFLRISSHTGVIMYRRTAGIILAKSTRVPIVSSGSVLVSLVMNDEFIILVKCSLNLILFQII